MRWQEFIPKSLRLQWKLQQRNRADQRAKVAFASIGNPNQVGQNLVTEISQRIMPNPNFESKLMNITLGAKNLNGVNVRPGELFSFWHLVGRPTAANGFRASRNLVNGALEDGIGGGLCQLSGIVYHTALCAGLEIVERHQHSVDIYREEERFSPLGADAAVVYGYKDLRLKNPHNTSIVLSVQVTGDALQCTLLSEGVIGNYEVEFCRVPKEHFVEVISIRNDGLEIARSLYHVPKA